MVFFAEKVRRVVQTQDDFGRVVLDMDSTESPCK